MASMVVDHRNVGAAFRRLSIPVGVQLLGDQLLGIVDTIAIGSLGVVALAGATAAGTLFLTVAFLLAGFCSGISIIGAQRIGNHDVEGFARSIRAGALVTTSVAIAAAAVSLFGAHAAVNAIAGNLPSAPASATYLILRCACLLPMAVSGTLIVGLGAAGNQKLGVLVIAIVNLVHIPLLLVLCLGWWTHHPFGIAGAGVSSLISETIAAGYAVYYTWKRPVYRIFSRWEWNWRLAYECARLGSPEAVFLFVIMLPDVLIVAMLAPLGAEAVSAFRALNIVSDLTFVVPIPLQSAVQTIIGQRLGARDVPGAQWFFARGRRVALWVSTIAGIAIAICARPLAYVFTLNAQVAASAALPLALHTITLPLKSWAMVSMAPIRAAGDTRFSMAMGIVCALLVPPFAYLGIVRLHIGLYAVPFAWIVAWTARGALTEFKLLGGEWTRTPALADRGL
jgi:putative MATE family efflux protein